jgi:hypothetical protein
MSLKKTRVILWVAVIVLFAIYAYVYVGNPLQKEFDLGLIGLIYSILFCLLWILFRKNRFKKEIALLASSGLLTIFYLVFL